MPNFKVTAPIHIVQSQHENELREINSLEKRIVESEDDADAKLWEQCSRVVALLESGITQRALAKQWINVRTGNPYSQMHIAFTRACLEKSTIQSHQGGGDINWLMGWADNAIEADLIESKLKSEYEVFLDRKTQSDNNYGFIPKSLPTFLFDFQSALTEWALRKGRGAIFADCGLGKTPMQLVWADVVVRHENKPVLILTPLAVSAQTIAEAHKFGIEAYRSSDGKHKGGIVVTNYERLHYFNWQDFAGVVCDESSILKSFDGARRTEITEFMRKIPYRLLCTATAAPNDYIELGTSSEALGELGAMDMLNRFFKNDSNNSDVGRSYGEVVKWRFKGHAEIPFWKWVCSWARAIRKPSDLGFEDGRFILPALHEVEHLIETRRPMPGMLFVRPAMDMYEQREERRRTIPERCEKVAELVSRNNRSLIWCHLNDEGDELQRLIPDAVQVSGKDSDEKKEEAFSGFANGSIARLITKPKIGAWGLNFQICNHVTVFPSHSYEQYYQGVRRCWRFGQECPVTVDIVTTEGERAVMANARRKAAAADRMFSDLTRYMNEASHIERGRSFSAKEVLPSWL